MTKYKYEEEIVFNMPLDDFVNGREVLQEIMEVYRKAEAFDEIKISYYMHIPNDMIGFAKQTEQEILRYEQTASKSTRLSEEDN